MGNKYKIIFGLFSLLAVLGGLVSTRASASNQQRLDEFNTAAVDPGTLTLEESIDGSTWTSILGNLTLGYSMVLDPGNTFEYIDIESMTATPALADGYYEFYFDAFRAPDDFWTYWAAKGVEDGATGWQGDMWSIISGEEPMFYLKADSGSYSLIDGYQYLFESTEAPLRVNGDYPLDTYHFGGWVTDTSDDQEYLNIQITFTKEAEVSLTPETSTIDGCGYVDVVIHLANVHDLYSLDLELSYDHTVLEVMDLDGVKPGVNLEPISTWFNAGYWVNNTANNTLGTIQYTATQLNTTAPADGEGDVAKIRFRAKSIGTSNITITKAELSDRDGFLVGRPVDYADPVATITTDFSAAAVDLGIIRLNPSTVQLSWPLQTMDAGAEYNLYRSTLPYFDISDPEVVEMNDASFVEGVDTVTYDDPVLGNVIDNYFYTLQIACSNGFESEPSWQVGKFEFELFETPTTDLTIIGFLLENPDLIDMNDLGDHIENNIYETVGVDVLAISTWNPSAQGFASFGYPSASPFSLTLKQPYRVTIDIDGDYFPYGSVIWAQVGKLPEITQDDYSLFETATTDYVWILQPLEMSGITGSTQLAQKIEADLENNVNVLAVSAWNGIAQNWTTGSNATRFGYPYRIAIDILGTQPTYYWP
jgi:hypothetical protein